MFDLIAPYLNNLALLGAAFGAVGFILGFVFKAHRFIRGHLLMVNDKLGKISELSIKIEDVHKEIKPNGGTSIKDVINEIAKKLRKIEKIQLALIESDEKALFITDPEGKLIYANAKMCFIFKKTSQQLVFNGWRNSLPQEKREIISHLWDNSVSEKREFEELIPIIADGKEILIQVSAIPYFDNLNNVLGYFGIIKHV